LGSVHFNQSGEKHKMTTDIKPRDAIKIAESHPDLTPKEREKTLALAIHFLLLEEPEFWKGRFHPAAVMMIMWEQSQLSSPYPIPDCDMTFINKLTANPAEFKDYR